jgi:hypothetical protein
MYSPIAASSTRVSSQPAAGTSSMNRNSSTVGPRIGAVSGSGIGSPESVTAIESRLNPPVSPAASVTDTVFAPGVSETVVESVAHSSQYAVGGTVTCVLDSPTVTVAVRSVSAGTAFSSASLAYRRWRSYSPALSTPSIVHETDAPVSALFGSTATYRPPWALAHRAAIGKPSMSPNSACTTSPRLSLAGWSARYELGRSATIWRPLK